MRRESSQLAPESKMRIISFNVNGIRSMLGKLKNGEKSGTPTNNVITSLIQEQVPDILCFQEIKTQNASDLDCFRKYFPHIYTNHSKARKGYSGVALLSKTKPIKVTYDFSRLSEEVIGNYTECDFHNEGRIITAEYDNYVVITCYTPNSKPNLERLDERVGWEAMMRNYMVLMEKETEKPVILCGDLNVAANNLEIHNPKGNTNSAGFTKEEREEFKKMLELGYVDCFRHLYPTKIKYTYWSNFANARANNRGWAIDKFIASEEVKDKIIEVDYLNEYFASDHCPIVVDIEL